MESKENSTKLQLSLSSLAFVACSFLIAPFLVVASGCPLKIQNIEFCADKGKYGAICAYWLDAKKTAKRIKKSDWDKKRVGMFCTSPQGIGEINALIEKACQTRKCVEQVKELVSALGEK